MRLSTNKSMHLRENLQSSAQLSSLETKLENISNRTSEATIEELISIADELRSMEKNLVEFDREREPWPKMEKMNLLNQNDKLEDKSQPQKKTFWTVMSQRVNGISMQGMSI